MCETGDAIASDDANDDDEDASGKRGQQHHGEASAADEDQWRQREVQTIVVHLQLLLLL